MWGVKLWLGGKKPSLYANTKFKLFSKEMTFSKWLILNHMAHWIVMLSPSWPRVSSLFHVHFANMDPSSCYLHTFRHIRHMFTYDPLMVTKYMFNIIWFTKCTKDPFGPHRQLITKGPWGSPPKTIILAQFVGLGALIHSLLRHV